MRHREDTSRDRKVARRKGRKHPVNGIAFKRLLIERAATRVDIPSYDRYEVQA